MSLRELRTLIAIAESGSFATAARMVGRTYAAGSSQMKVLEDEFQVALFDRTSRPICLTPARHNLVPYGIEAVAAYDRLFQILRNSMTEGCLRLGAVSSVMTGVIPSALADLRGRCPGLHVELTTGLSEDLVARVQNGVVDAAIVSDLKFSHSGMTWSPFAREPLVLIAPMDVPPLAAEDLLVRHPFIRYARHTWVGEIIEAFLRSRKFHVREVMALDTLDAVRISCWRRW